MDNHYPPTTQPQATAGNPFIPKSIMFSSLLSGTLGEILAPSPSVSAEKKEPSSEQEQQEQQQQEASGQGAQTYSMPRQEEDAAARASVNKTLADASTLFPFPEVEKRAAPSPSPTGVTPTAAMTDPAATDVTGMLANLSLADEKKEQEQEQQTGRQSAAAVLMPPPPPPSMSNSSSLASLRPPPPTPGVTPPSSKIENEGEGDRGDSINSNLLPAFATPSKQTPGTGRKGSAARRRYTVSPMLSRTPKKMEPRLGDMVLKVGQEGRREGGKEGETLTHRQGVTLTHRHNDSNAPYACGLWIPSLPPPPPL